MATTFTVIPQGTYPVGTYASPARAVPVGVTLVVLALDGAAMLDPALHITLKIDYSPDDGVTWASVNPNATTDPYPIVAGFNAGQLVRGGPDEGLPLPSYAVQCRVPNPESTTRLMRATVVVAGIPVTTVGTLTLS